MIKYYILTSCPYMYVCCLYIISILYITVLINKWIAGHMLNVGILISRFEEKGFYLKGNPLTLNCYFVVMLSLKLVVPFPG